MWSSMPRSTATTSHSPRRCTMLCQSPAAICQAIVMLADRRGPLVLRSCGIAVYRIEFDSDEFGPCISRTSRDMPILFAAGAVQILQWRAPIRARHAGSPSVSDMQHVICSARDWSFLTRHLPRSGIGSHHRAEGTTVLFGERPRC
jgi:hypothetical protein